MQREKSGHILFVLAPLLEYRTIGYSILKQNLNFAQVGKQQQATHIWDYLEQLIISHNFLHIRTSDSFANSFDIYEFSNARNWP